LIDPAGVINHVISVLGKGPQKQAHRLPADKSETEFAELFDLSHVKDEFVRKRFIKLAYRFCDIFATYKSHLRACEDVKHSHLWAIFSDFAQIRSALKRKKKYKKLENKTTQQQQRLKKFIIKVLVIFTQIYQQSVEPILYQTIF